MQISQRIDLQIDAFGCEHGLARLQAVDDQIAENSMTGKRRDPDVIHMDGASEHEAGARSDLFAHQIGPPGEGGQQHGRQREHRRQAPQQPSRYSTVLAMLECGMRQRTPHRLASGSR